MSEPHYCDNCKAMREEGQPYRAVMAGAVLFDGWLCTACWAEYREVRLTLGIQDSPTVHVPVMWEEA